MRGRGPLSFGRRLRRFVLLLLALLGVVVALGVAVTLGPKVGRDSDWVLRRTTEPRRTGVFRDPSVSESSGVAASRRQPGILWTLNDSGDGPWIYATDTLGRDHGAFEVTEASNRDWEAIASGPCGPRDCLYIADTGNNERDRRSATIYRVPEPTLPGDRRSTAPAEALEFRYPGGRWDVEAIFVDPAGTAYLITKGRGVAPTLFRLGPESWRVGEVVTAEEVGRLPIDSRGLGNPVTDAALSPSGRVVAVRTYVAIYLFHYDSEADPPLRPTGVACDAAGLQLQGEGLAWLDEKTLVLTSEAFGTRGTVVLLGCGGAVAHGRVGRFLAELEVEGVGPSGPEARNSLTYLA
jgi:hypothetical protein